jgi:hypothetical protein
VAGPNRISDEPLELATRALEAQAVKVQMRLDRESAPAQIVQIKPSLGSDPFLDVLALRPEAHRSPIAELYQSCEGFDIFGACLRAVGRVRPGRGPDVGTDRTDTADGVTEELFVFEAFELLAGRKRGYPDIRLFADVEILVPQPPQLLGQYEEAIGHGDLRCRFNL